MVDGMRTEALSRLPQVGRLASASEGRTVPASAPAAGTKSHRAHTRTDLPQRERVDSTCTRNRTDDLMPVWRDRPSHPILHRPRSG